VTVLERAHVLALVAEAVERGARQNTACEMVGVGERTYQRWQLPTMSEGGRRRQPEGPQNTLSQDESENVLIMIDAAQQRGEKDA
jgi:putative transposase